MKILTLALVPTILIEMLTLWLLGEREKIVLLTSVPINIATNVPLNLYVMHVSSSLTAILLGELMVVAVEALVYCWLLHNVRRAIICSILCNAMSFLSGLLLQRLYIGLIH